MKKEDIQTRIWSAIAVQIVDIAGEIALGDNAGNFVLVSDDRDLAAGHHNIVLDSADGPMVQVISRKARYPLTSVSVYASCSGGNPISGIDLRDGEIIVSHNGASHRLSEQGHEEITGGVQRIVARALETVLKTA